MGEFTTGAAACERFRALLDVVDVAYAEMRELSSDNVGNEFRVDMAERLETQERTNRGLMYRVFGQIADPPDEIGLIDGLIDRLCARLRIPRNEIKRRMKVAARIQPRRQLTGPPLPPELPLVADAVTAGTIGEDHLREIEKAMDRLPSSARRSRTTPTLSSRLDVGSMKSSIPMAISTKPTVHADVVW
jgi:hypothetical protein